MQFGVDILNVGRGHGIELCRRNLSGLRGAISAGILLNAHGSLEGAIQVGLRRQNRIKTGVGDDAAYLF